MLAQPPRLLTDDRDSVASQTLGVQQEGDSDSEEAVKPQTVGLATAQCEIDIKEEEDEDWQFFKEAFEHDDCIEPQAKVAAGFLSSPVVMNSRPFWPLQRHCQLLVVAHRL